VGPSEHRSPRLGRTVIRAFWLAWWRCPFFYEVSEHQTFDRKSCDKVQFKLNQLYSHLAMLLVALGLWRMALSGYDVTTKIL
jgi:hypothetical protein